MPGRSAGLAILVLLASAPVYAQGLDVLNGKFAFNWHTNPDRETCAAVTARLLADFKSAKYRCDLNVKTNTASGAPARTCTAKNGRREYLIFDTRRACEEERKTQAANE